MWTIRKRRRVVFAFTLIAVAGLSSISLRISAERMPYLTGRDTQTFDEFISRSITVLNQPVAQSPDVGEAFSRAVTVVNEPIALPPDVGEAFSRAVTVVNEPMAPPPDMGEALSRAVTVWNPASIELTLDVGYDAEFVATQSTYYRVTVPEGETLHVSLVTASGTGLTELFVRFGQHPTRSEFDFSQEMRFVADPEVFVPETQAGTYYILVYAVDVLSPPESYTILAEVRPFEISSVEPSSGSGEVTLRIEGGCFESEIQATTQFTLVAPDESEIVPEKVIGQNAGTAFATFNLDPETVAAGLYDIKAVNPDQTETVLEDAFEVVSGTGPDLRARIVAPGSVRSWCRFVVQVEYANVGSADMTAPLLELVSDPPLEVAFHPDGPYQTTPIRMLGVNPNGPAGTLPPGAAGIITLYVQGVGPGSVQPGLHWLTGIAHIDWEATETEVRPPDVSDALWDMVWERLKVHVGDTWSDLEDAMGSIATRFWSDGVLVYNFSELFAEELELAWDDYPCRISGVLVHAETKQPLGDVEIVAWSDADGDGNADVISAMVSDLAGGFQDTIPAGTYELLAEGYYFDPPIFVELTTDQDARSLVLPAIPFPESAVPPDPPDIPDRYPSLTSDGHGNVQMIWNRGAEVWHARFDGVSWAVTGPVGVSNATGLRVGPGPAIEGSDAVTILWEYGFGNESELLYAVGKPDLVEPDSFIWTEPNVVTSDTYGDNGAAMLMTELDELLIVWLKKDYSIEDDTDLYYRIDPIMPLKWREWEQDPRELTQKLLLRDDQFECGFTIKEGTLIPEGVPVIGGWFGFELNISASGEVGCTLGVDLGASLSVELGPPKESPADPDYSVEGSAGGNASWVVDKRECRYLFEKGLFNAGFSFTGKIPLYQIPIKGRLRKYVHAVLGAQVHGGFSGEIGYKGAGFPRWPNSGGFDLTGGGGPYGEIKFGTDPKDPVAHVQAAGDFTVSGGWNSEDGWFLRFYCFMFKGSAKVWIFKYDFRACWPPDCHSDCEERLRASMEPGALVIRSYGDSRAGVDEFVELVISIDPLTGTGSAYPGLTVISDVSGDLWNDGVPSVTSTPAGEILAIWTKDTTDPNAMLGQAIVVGSYVEDTWSAPTELTSAANFNNGPQVVVDSSGTPMAVWSHASADGLSLQNSVEEILDAAGANDLVYSQRLDGNWSPAMPLAAIPGSDESCVLAADHAGRILAAWMHTDSPMPEDAEVSIYAAVWDGAAWSTATQLAMAPECRTVSCQFVQGVPVVVWDADADGDTENTPHDLTLYYSVHDGVWSPGVAIPKWSPPDRPVTRTTDCTVALDQIQGNIPTDCCGECQDNSDCDDEIACTVDTCEHVCVEDGDDLICWKDCLHTPDNTQCDDGVFCNGQEACDPDSGCRDGHPPCPPNSTCIESEERCGCSEDWQCEDGNECTINECVDGTCQSQSKYCGDADACTSNGCNPTTGCVSTSTGEPHHPPIGSWQPVDPNEKIGPTGYGEDGWVPATATLPYTIRFENLARSCLGGENDGEECVDDDDCPDGTCVDSIPAVIVSVTDQLSANLDWETLRLGAIGFGDTLVVVPPDRTQYQTEVDLTASSGLVVQVEAGIDIMTGEVHWSLTAIDPVTGQIPADPDVGFLPPNITPPEGEGFVTFTVKPRPEAPTSTTITNGASIVFDWNDPIETNETVNTIDADIPASSMDPLPPEIVGEGIPLSWSGEDPTGGSDLALFAIYIAVDDGPFVPFLGRTTETETTFTGTLGHTYAFYSRASDNVGNVEPIPLEPDAVTTLRSAASPMAEPVPASDKNRFLSFAPTNAGRETALRVTLASLPSEFSSYEGTQYWVGEPFEMCENSGQGPEVDPENCGPAWVGGPVLTMWSANLQSEPYCYDFGSVGTLHVTDCEIVPGGTYTVEAIDCAADPGNELNYSVPLLVSTSSWGDICNTYDGTHWTAPNGTIDVTLDVTACLEKFKNAQGAPIKARCDVDPNVPDGKVNITTDVTRILDAFRGYPYPFPGPGTCPP